MRPRKVPKSIRLVARELERQNKQLEKVGMGSIAEVMEKANWAQDIFEKYSAANIIKPLLTPAVDPKMFMGSSEIARAFTRNDVITQIGRIPSLESAARQMSESSKTWERVGKSLPRAYGLGTIGKGLNIPKIPDLARFGGSPFNVSRLDSGVSLEATVRNVILSPVNRGYESPAVSHSRRGVSSLIEARKESRTPHFATIQTHDHGRRPIPKDFYVDLIRDLDGYDFVIDGVKKKALKWEDGNLRESPLTASEFEVLKGLIATGSIKRPCQARSIGRDNPMSSNKTFENARKKIDIKIGRYKWTLFRTHRYSDRSQKAYQFDPPDGTTWILIDPHR